MARQTSQASVTSGLLAPIGLVYVLFLLAPVSFFLSLSLQTYDPFTLYRAELTGANFARLVFDPYYRGILGTTLKVAALTTLSSLVLAYPLALFLARSRSAWRGVLLFLVVAPLMTGIIVRTYAWIVILGSEGTLNSALLHLGFVDQPLRLLGTETAVTVGLVHILMPYMVFPLFSAISGQDPDLVRAASTLGASRVSAFLAVTLPLSVSGILMGSVLVFTLAAGAVVTSALLGGTSVVMLGQTIYDLVMRGLNWPLASAAACLLIGAQLFIVAVYLKGGRRGAATAGAH
jgi:putative spermidine/putrescine transport system permease protein